LQSEKGKGSIFSFKLEFDKSENKPSPINEYKGKVVSQRKGHALIVDDNIVSQKVLYKMLEKIGYSADVANNGIEALTLHEAKKYDIILMDIQMPKIDGLEATKRIKNAESGSRQTPIIALTAFALTGDRETFLSAGMDEYLSKPICIEKLYSIIDKVAMREVQAVMEYENFNKENIYLETNINPKEEYSYDKYIDNIKQAINRGNSAQVERSAHELKYIFQENEMDTMKNYAFKLELSSRRNNFEQAQSYVQKIENELLNN